MSGPDGNTSGRTTASPDEREQGVRIAVRWWVAQIVATALAWVNMWFSPFSLDSCNGSSCDYDLFWTSLNAFYIGAIVLVVAAGVGIFFLRNTGRAFVSPLVGIVLLIVWLATMYGVGRAALNLPYVQ